MKISISELTRGQNYRHTTDCTNSYWRREDKKTYKVRDIGPLNERYPHLGLVILTNKRQRFLYLNPDEIVEVVKDGTK